MAQDGCFQEKASCRPTAQERWDCALYATLQEAKQGKYLPLKVDEPGWMHRSLFSVLLPGGSGDCLRLGPGVSGKARASASACIGTVGQVEREGELWAYGLD